MILCFRETTNVLLMCSQAIYEARVLKSQRIASALRGSQDHEKVRLCPEKVANRDVMNNTLTLASQLQTERKNQFCWFN